MPGWRVGVGSGPPGSAYPPSPETTEDASASESEGVAVCWFVAERTRYLAAQDRILVSQDEQFSVWGSKTRLGGLSWDFV